MAETSTFNPTSFNVLTGLEKDIAQPTVAPANAVEALQQDQMLRRLHEASVRASSLAEPQRSQRLEEIAGLQSQIRNGMVGGIQAGGAVDELISAIGSDSTEEAQETQSEIFTALDGMNPIRLSRAGEALVHRRMHAIETGNYEEFAATYRRRPVPQFMQAEQRDLQQAADAQARQQFNQISSLPPAQRQHVMQAMREQEARHERVQAQSENHNLTPVQRNALTLLNSTPLYMLQSSEALVTAIEQHAPDATVRQLTDAGVHELAGQIVTAGAVPIFRQRNGINTNFMIDHAPTPDRDHLRTDDQAYAENLVRVAGHYSEDQHDHALHHLARLGGTREAFNHLSADEQMVITSHSQLESISLTVAMQNAMERASGLLSLRQNGITLTASDQRHLANLDRIGNSSVDLNERAQLLTQVMQGRNSAAASSSREGNLGLAAVTIGFIDGNGGITTFLQNSQTLHDPDATPAQHQQAQAYMQRYEQYLNTTIMRGGFDPNDPTSTVRWNASLEMIGQGIQHGQYALDTDATGKLQIQDRQSGTVKDHFYEAPNVLSQYVEAKETEKMRQAMQLPQQGAATVPLGPVVQKAPLDQAVSGALSNLSTPVTMANGDAAHASVAAPLGPKVNSPAASTGRTTV